MNDVAADEFTTSDSRPYLGYGMPWNHWTDMIPLRVREGDCPLLMVPAPKIHGCAAEDSGRWGGKEKCRSVGTAAHFFCNRSEQTAVLTG